MFVMKTYLQIVGLSLICSLLLIGASESSWLRSSKSLSTPSKKNISNTKVLAPVLPVLAPNEDEVDFINPVLPQLVICGNKGTASIQVIKLATGNTINHARLTIDLDNGLEYAGSFTAGNCPGGTVNFRSDLSNTSKIVFDFPNMNFNNCPSIVLTFDIKVDCSVLDILEASPNSQFNWQYTMTYDGGADTRIETPLSAVHKPQLTLSKPASVISAPGSVTERSFTICQTAVDAYIKDTLLITELGSAGMRVRGIRINNGPEINTYISGNAGNQSIKIPPSEFSNAVYSGTTQSGNSNLFLDGPEGGVPGSKPECLIITEILEVNSCEDINSSVTAFWGCEGTYCASSETIHPGIEIDINAGAKLAVSENFSNELCPGLNYQRELKVTNIGKGTAKNIDFDIYLSTTGIQPALNCNGNALDVESYQISVNGGPFQSIIPTSNYSINDCSSFLGCFAGEPAHVLSTLRLPDLAAGDSVRIKYIKKMCCPTQAGYYYALGEAARARFTDNCGTPLLMQPVEMSQIYALSRSGIQNESLTDVNPGQLFSINLIYHELSFSNYNNNSEVIFKLKIPDGVIWSGSQGDFSWSDPSGPRWTVSDFNYDVATKLLEIKLKVIDFINLGIAKTNTEITLRNLSFDCGSTGLSTVQRTFNYEVRYNSDPNCACSFLLADGSANMKMHCRPDPNCVGLEFVGFSIQRSTFGLTDANDDGVADNNNFVNAQTPGVKYKRVITGDELISEFVGVVRDYDGNSNWPFLYAESEFENASETQLVSAQLTLWTAGGSTIIDCDNIQGTLTNDRWTFDLSIPSLKSHSCADPDLSAISRYRNGDSISLKVKYKLIKNIPGAVIENHLNNEFYISSIPDPNASSKYQCDNYTGNFIYHGYKMIYLSEPAVFAGCEEKSIDLTYYFDTENSANPAASNLFPREYRSLMHLNNIYANIPSGFNFTKAEVTLKKGGGSGKSTDIGPSSILPFSQNGNRLEFDLTSFYKSNQANGPWQDPDDGFIIIMKIFSSPECDAPAESYLTGGARSQPKTILTTIDPNGNNLDTTDNLLSNYPAFDQFKFFFSRPELFIQSSQQTFNGNSANVSWPVNITNVSNNANAKNIWISFQTNPAGPQISKVLLNGNVITAQGGGYFALGDLTTSIQEMNLEVFANQTGGCQSDSIVATVGWACNSYPQNLNNLTCSPLKFPLFVRPLHTNMDVSVLLPAESNPVEIYDLCEDIEFVVQVDNIGQAEASNILLDAYVPQGMELIPGSSYIQYKIVNTVPPTPNINSGSWKKIGDPSFVGNVALGQNYRWNVTSLWQAATGNNLLGGPGGSFPYQIQNLDSSKFYIRFLAQSSCGFLTGTRIPFVASAQSPCQLAGSDRISSLLKTSAPIHIIDPKTLYGARIKFDTDTVRLDACGTKNPVKIVMYNFGPGSTRTTDSIKLKLPVGFKYIVGTSKNIHQFGGAEPVVMNMGSNGTKLCWAIGTVTTPGDSVKFEFQIDVDPTQLPCSGVTQFMNMVITTRDLVCVDNGEVCRTQLTLAEANPPVTYGKASYSIKFHNLTCPDASGKSELSMRINVSGAALDASQNIRVRLVHDQNFNGQLDLSEIANAVFAQAIFQGPFVIGNNDVNQKLIADSVKVKHAFILLDGTCYCNPVWVKLVEPYCKPCIPIGDFVWNDTNGDGIQNVGEKGINGVSVFLYNKAGQVIDADRTRTKPGTSDQEGYYKFCQCAGEYYIQFQVSSLTASPYHVGLDNTKDSDVSHANGPNTTNYFTALDDQMYCDYDAGFSSGSQVGDHIWIDRNYNGIQEESESHLQGVTVSAFKPDGTQLAKTISDQYGRYQLTAPAGIDLYFKFQLPAGYQFTTAKSGTDDKADSDVNGKMGYGTTALMRLNAGQSYMNIDAGAVGSVLAIDDLTISARDLEDHILLEWHCISPANVQSYELEKMNSPASGFQSIYKITEGIQAGKQTFEYKDIKDKGFSRIHYRIKRTDEDGSCRYSEIVGIDIQVGVAYCTINPNPVVDHLSLNIYDPSSELVSLRIISMDGSRTMQLDKKLKLKNGSIQKSYSLSTLTPGIYWLEISGSEGDVWYEKFIKQ